MPDSSPARLLIMDDEAAQMKALCNTLEPAGYSTTGFTSPDAALAILRNQPFDLILTDLNMVEMDGIAFLQAAREIDPDMVGIVMTGQGTINTAVQAMQAGALDYILKPFKLSAVLPVLARAVAVRQLRLENIDLQQAMGIYELSMVIRSTLDFDTILQKVADAAMGDGQVRSVSILLPIEEGKALRVAMARGEHAVRDEGKRIPFDGVLADWVDRSLERISRLNELADVHPALPLSLPELPDGAFIPMLAGGRFTGILHFTSGDRRRPDSPSRVKALNMLAGAAASAIEAASLLEQLRSAERRYRSLSESAVDMIFRYELHPTPHLAYINPVAASVTGYEPEEYYADPDLIFKIVHPADRRLMEAVLRGGFPSGSTITLRCVHRNGFEIWIEQRNSHSHDFDGRLIAIDGIARDITERKHLEEQLRQSQKMEAIGLLAGGVAHDFNNLLTVIMGYSDLVLEDKLSDDRTIEKVSQVKRAAEHAAALTRGLLAFGRREIVEPKVLDINTVVETSLKILRRIIGEDIELVTILDAKQGTIRADPGRMEQILMNLVVNSKAAMPEGGVITIETQNVVFEGSRAAQAPAGKPGTYVSLAVSDTGCGMDEATRARIFEPFFTTKEVGQGTGLGLSIVHGIVTQSGGDIRVFSRPGHGTKFEIVLPHSEALQKDAVSGVPAAVSGSETILVVEDDAEVRQLVGAVLKSAGYKVLFAREGNEALRIYEDININISLILTDVIMPGMSGPVLIETIGRLKPAGPKRDLKALYMSGYAGDTLASHGWQDRGVPFIQKPFTAIDLLAKVREILDSRDSPVANREIPSGSRERIQPVSGL